MLSRRHVLSYLMAAPVVLGCAPAASSDPAEAWRSPGAGETDPRRFALSHAILAPNPHNTQPWLIDLDDSDGATLNCDLDRRLPFTDPFDRQITIGLGAFCELYRIAAAHLGYETEIAPFPEGAPAGRLDQRPVARLRLGAQSAPHDDALFAQITRRRTNRNPYEARAPETASLASIGEGASSFSARYGFTGDTAKVAQLRDLAWRAFDREMRTQGAGEETFRWLRFGRDEIARHRDGISIDGPMIPLLHAVGQLDEHHIIDPDSLANRTTADDWRRKVETAPAFAWLSTDGDTPEARFNAGRAYVRMNLTAAQLGLAMHPWSQALQEYSEMADLYAEMRAALGAAETETLQMFVRVGYAEASLPSPRRNFEAALRA